MKKLVLSFTLLGILGVTSMMAESDGWFVGGQLGLRGTDTKVDASSSTDGYLMGDGSAWSATYSSTGANVSGSDSGAKLGFLGGYKQFFDPKFGARYYFSADFLDYTQNYNINADVLYNFASKDIVEFGAFGGLWLGYAIHDMGLDTAKGVDLGINIGLKAQIAQNHGVELFGHFGFLKQKYTLSDSMTEYGDYGYGSGSSDIEVKISQPYHIGIRYTYSF